MPTLRYYDGTQYQALPGMPGPTGPVGPAGPTGAQGPVASGVTPNYVAQGWLGATTTGSTIMTLPAPGLKANHSYLISGYVIGSNTSAGNAQVRFGLNLASAGTAIGPNQGVWIKWMAATANDVLLPNQWTAGCSGSFIYVPAADGDQSFQIFNIGTAGAVSVATGQAAIFVMDMTGTQGPIGATGPTGPAGPAGGGTAIVSVRAWRSAAMTLSGTDTIVVMDTEQWDTANAYNPATGLFTCPQAGKYRVVGQVPTAASGAASQFVVSTIYKNGVSVNQNYMYASAASMYLFGQSVDTLDLAVGDTVGIYARCSASLGISAGQSNTYMCIDLLSGSGPQGATGPTGPAYAAGQMYSLVYYQTIPAPKAASSPFVVTHNLGTTFPMVQLWDAITLQNVNAQIQVVDANHVQVAVAADMPNPVNVSIMGVAASPVPINPGDLATKAYVDAKTATLPAPVTSGSGIQSFTDALGDVWVAKNGVNGGNWARASNALYARVWRSAALTTSGVTMSWDTVTRDVYGLWGNVGSPTVLVAPVAGIYDVDTEICFTPTAAGQYIQNRIYVAGVMVSIGETTAASTTGITAMAHYTGYFNAGDNTQLQINNSASLALSTQSYFTWAELKYRGTG